ncbi:uncharacterized protein [Epargyreus clarus]|uniref:uncharacterized protein n=1 Tax=Epargyreus clarus TaxID=520877 RepID=UPI003C2FB627
MDTTANQRVSCIANYAYDASEPDELTIRPGDVLRDVDQLSGGWWRGELKGRRGMFPDNFVSILTEQNNTRPAGVQGRCRAVFSYQPANSDELPLCVGDVLEVLGEVEEGWWQGRRQGRVGVFPSNFVVMLEPPPAHAAPFEPAPALPPKPIKEQCRVLFPYAAVNEDELSLAEGDVVTLVSRDTSDRGWWRGELHGRVGLFPDNFVQLLPAVASAPEEESKPERPPSKASNAIYPVLNKYSEKTASVKELTTSKISMHKESTISKESSTHSTVTHTNKSESEKLVHSKTTTDGALDGLKFSDDEIYASKFSMPKKPSVPLKKSPTPTSAVGGLFSGLKNKMMPTSDKEKADKTSSLSSGSSNGSEWDRPDGAAPSKPAPAPSPASASASATPSASTPAPAATNANTFDHVERNSILNDPRAGRAKAPRRRPPSQALRDDTPQQIGLSNGHEVPSDRASDKAEEIKPRAREWEKHKAPWMEELKLNQAKKTGLGDGKRSASAAAAAGSTDRILDCGLEEKRASHSMEMSKSTSSISNRISVLESLESSLEAKVRHSLEGRREPPSPPAPRPPLHSPTAAGRTLTSMLDEIKKPPAPAPPTAVRTDPPSAASNKLDKVIISSEKIETSSISKLSGTVIESSHKSSTIERTEKLEEKLPEKLPEKEKPPESPIDLGERSATLERRLQPPKADKTERSEGADALIAQLNDRISNLEKLLEVQNAKFNAAMEQLKATLYAEVEKRQALQADMEKLAHCVTQV